MRISELTAMDLLSLKVNNTKLESFVIFRLRSNFIFYIEGYLFVPQKIVLSVSFNALRLSELI